MLHWHGDRFDLPVGARRLAFNPHDANQAFAVGAAGLGLQFHLETDPRGLEEWYVGHAVELGTAGIDLRQLRREGVRCAAATRAVAIEVFGDWIDQLFTPAARIEAEPVPAPALAPLSA